jgi:hypothetical protein
MKKGFAAIFVLLIVFNLLARNPEAAPLNQTVFKSLTRTDKLLAKKADVTADQILNNEKRYWRFDPVLNAFVNDSMKSSLSYFSGFDYNKPLKLKIYSPDMEEGLEIKVRIDKSSLRVLEKKGNFKYSDYNEGNMEDVYLNLANQETTLIDNIFAVKAECDIYFQVILKSNIPAGKHIRIYYKMSEL